MQNLKSKIEFLFNQNFFSDDFDPEGEIPEIAEEIMERQEVLRVMPIH